MGAGIAQVAATRRHGDRYFSTVLDKGKATIEKNLGRLVKKEKITQADADTAMARIQWVWNCRHTRTDKSW